MSKITNRSVLCRYRTCSCGKRGFEQKQYAKALCRELGGGMRVYRCPESGTWHAGHARSGSTREDYRRLAMSA